MKRFLFALLLIPTMVSAQYTNPDQQAIWNNMIDAAPAHEMLIVCGRDVTAGLVREQVWDFASQFVATENDIEVVNDMWKRAQTQARLDNFDSLRTLEQIPEGAICNDLENRIIQILGEGV